MASKKLIADIKKELKTKIDENDSIQLEKVERYINLVTIYYKLDESIDELGTMITTENGSQRFTKPNPAIAEKNKINTSLIALGKDLGLDAKKDIIQTTQSYSKSDLL